MDYSIKWLFSAIFLFISSIVLLSSNHYVKPVFAGCSGKVYCGETRYRCSISKANCALTSCPFGAGSCVEWCDETQGAMACSGIGNEWTCDQVSTKDCASGCSTDPSTPCTWTPPCTTGAWYSCAGCDDGDCLMEHHQPITLN